MFTAAAAAAAIFGFILINFGFTAVLLTSFVVLV